MNNLAKYRKQLNFSQGNLAEAAGFGRKPSRIANYESGFRAPSLDECRALTLALAAAGATNETGNPVTLDDVFPPENSEPIAANS